MASYISESDASEKKSSEQTRFRTSCRTLSPSGGGIGTLANVLLNFEFVPAAYPGKKRHKGDTEVSIRVRLGFASSVVEPQAFKSIGNSLRSYRVGLADRSRVIYAPR